MIKLIALDMDGTCVTPNPNHQNYEYITKPVKEAIENAQRKGIIVVFATGRWYNAVKHHFESLKFKGPQILNNGATVIDTHGVVHSKVAIAKPDYISLVNAMLSKEIKLAVCTEYDMVHCSEESEELGFKQWFSKKENLFDLNYAAKIIALHGGKWLANKVLNDYPYLQEAGHADNYLEIWPKLASKGLALMQVAAHYGLTMDEVMGVGDGTNDFDMLKRAGVGVAMGQAGEKVKAYADVICPSLEEDGVAWVIEQTLAGKIG
ncbi:MAG: Cof-type HAD-IIB family hydrolase [Spirochaetaceae bacterium]|nr:Cof-type HAD-IIB family hydrolase [Spirochaetaceae bacterium]